MHSTVSHMLVIITVKKEYLQGLSLNSMISFSIFMIAEKHKNDEITMTAANSIVAVALFYGTMVSNLKITSRASM